MRWKAILLAATACAPQQTTQTAVAPEGSPGVRIDTTAIRGYTRFLADDRLAGRATGFPGADVAALYIASACTGLGLSPVGPSHFQPVELEEAMISASGTEFSVTGPGGPRTFSYPRSFLPNVGLVPPASFGGPAMYGATSDDLLAAGAPSVSGGVAVIAGAVGRAADDSLKARGAVGLVQLTADEGQYLLFVRSRGGSRLRLADSSIERSFSSALPTVVAAPELSRRLVGAAVAGGAKAARLTDSVIVHVRFERRAVKASNVLCLLPGTDPKLRDTAVAYSAHYDHLGVGAPDHRGDSIYNGFSDNAAGVGMLLAIAQAFGGRARPPYSVLFLFFSGEEHGLLGSDYYVARPSWPLGRIRGVINLDAGAPPARPWSWRIAGGDQQPLGRLAQDVAAEHGWSATTSPATPNSDYFPFVRAGVPAVFIVPGPGPYQGLSVDSSQALRRRWDHYHDPADEWAPDFPFAGLGRYAEYAYYLGRAVGEGRRKRPSEPVSGPVR